MKKFVYLFIMLCFVMGCSHQGISNNDSSDTVYIAPDSVWDYSYIDSVHHALRCKAYEIYGDSDATGLPDSVMSRKDSIERLRE